MANAIYVPRINNNDDEVKVLAFDVHVGDKVQTGQIGGQVETDKAVLDVTAVSDGYVLGCVAKAEEVVRVGSVMLWLGESRDETMPEAEAATTGQSASKTSSITAKARILLEKNSLQADVIPPIDGRVTVEAIERYLAANSGVIPAVAQSSIACPSSSAGDITITAGSTKEAPTTAVPTASARNRLNEFQAHYAGSRRRIWTLAYAHSHQKTPTASTRTTSSQD